MADNCIYVLINVSINLNDTDFKWNYQNLFYLEKTSNTLFQIKIDKKVSSKVEFLANNSYASIVTAFDLNYTMERLNAGKLVG